MFQHRCNLRDITLRYRSRIERATDCMILFTEDVQNRQIYRERKHVSGCLELGLDGGGGERGVAAGRYEFSFQSHENVLKLNPAEGCPIL